MDTKIVGVGRGGGGKMWGPQCFDHLFSCVSALKGYIFMKYLLY